MDDDITVHTSAELRDEMRVENWRLSDRITALEAESAKLKAALKWTYDRISVDFISKKEIERTGAEIGNVLQGNPSPASTYQPNEWDDSAALKEPTNAELDAVAPF